MPPSLLQLSISPGEMPKRAVAAARVTFAGVEGDAQRNLKVHGGPDRAVCLFSAELYAQLKADGIDIQPGDVGENFTTRGIDLLSLIQGDRLQVGQCLIEITKIRVPCKQLKQWHNDLPKKIEGRSGWMARVLKEGTVSPGDAVELIMRSNGAAHVAT